MVGGMLAPSSRMMALGASLVLQRGEHHVAGERDATRHLGGGQVADLATSVMMSGSLARISAQALGEVRSEMHLPALVERGLDHLDRVFHRAHVPVPLRWRA
jgi:hypothetical protein